MDYEKLYLLLEDLAYLVRDDTRGSNKPTYYTFNDNTIVEPTVTDIDAKVRQIILEIDRGFEGERNSGYDAGYEEGYDEGYDNGYEVGYDAGRDDRGYDNDEAYDRSIGN